MSGDLVQDLKRAGEQVLGAKGLTGNDHVRLSALFKVAALEIEALCAARDDAAELRAALVAARRAIGDHNAPGDCYATGPVTGDAYRDLVECPACSAIPRIDAALAATEGQP